MKRLILLILFLTSSFFAVSMPCHTEKKKATTKKEITFADLTSNEKDTTPLFTHEDMKFMSGIADRRYKELRKYYGDEFDLFFKEKNPFEDNNKDVNINDIIVPQNTSNAKDYLKFLGDKENSSKTEDGIIPEGEQNINRTNSTTIEGSFIDIIVPISFFVMMVLVVYFTMKYNYKIKKEILDKGRNIEPLDKKVSALEIGVISSGIGLGLAISVFFQPLNLPKNAKDILSLACILFFGGCGLVSAFFIRKRLNEKKKK